MDQNLGKLLQLHLESIKRSAVSPEMLLSLLLAGKILKQDELAAYQQVPAEDRINFLFERVEKKNNDTVKAFIDMLEARFPTNQTHSVRKSEHSKWNEGEWRIIGHNGLISN